MPEISDITDSSMTLTWDAPADDGGAPITNYVIERQKRGETTWTEVPTPDEKTIFVVKDLETEANYVIRVSAQNKVRNDS